MFLSVQRADCFDILDKLTDMLKRVLKYSVQTPAQTLDFAELKELMDPNLTFLFGKRAFQTAVKKLFDLSFNERTEIYLAFCNDISFERHIDDAEYRLCPLSEKTKAGEALKNLCTSLFKAVFGKNSSNKAKTGLNFSMAMLETQYARINGEYGKVCPVCVSEILFCEKEGEADHYFPKSKYPALTFHSYNILPTCPACNGSTVKHSKSPVDNADIGPGELRTVFLPYLRAARQDIEFKVADNPKRHIVMNPKPDADENTAKRIENMERLYNLGERWSLVLENVYDDITAELSEKCSASASGKNRLDELRKTLEANANSCKDRKDFVKGVYCAWLQTKSDKALDELFTVL